eukprot:6626443-Lingulodinium_polyedra.AAC.1
MRVPLITVHALHDIQHARGVKPATCPQPLLPERVECFERLTACGGPRVGPKHACPMASKPDMPKRPCH